MNAPVLRLGTRRSALAWAQSSGVARALQERHAGLQVKLFGIDTRGDRIQDRPLEPAEGTAFFSDEIDAALLRGEIDLAVHSLKDLALERPRGLSTVIPKRALPHDVLLCVPDILERIGSGQPIRIGTSSPRRQALLVPFLRQALPGGRSAELLPTPIRGNIDTRLGRLREAEDSPRRFDAVVLALAGLQRLWSAATVHTDLATETRSRIQQLLQGLRVMVLPLSECPGAPGQGALAVECRADDAPTRAILAVLHDPETASAVEAERALLRQWGGGCQQALGAISMTHPRLGGLLFIKGQRDAKMDLWQECVWERAAQLAKPKAPFRAWDGSREGRPERHYLTDASKRAAQTLRSQSACFIAHHHAVPQAMAGSARIWTSGVKSWFALAERGLWVEGCADGLGFDSLRTLLEEPLLGLPPFAEWQILTHSGAERSWQPATALATYTLSYDTARGAPPADTTHIYWSSAAQFEAFKHALPALVHHACGPGNTAALLASCGVRPCTVFPSNAAWRSWLGLTA